jgi:hypothetical protein
MSTSRLSNDEVVALARMARGGVYLDREGRAVVPGGAEIDSATVTGFADAGLVDLDSGMIRLTGIGRAALAGQAGVRTASPAGAAPRP